MNDYQTCFLEGLMNNDYSDMCSNIRQFISDANPEITVSDYSNIEELHGHLFDQDAWDYMWKTIKGN